MNYVYAKKAQKTIKKKNSKYQFKNFPNSQTFYSYF